MYKLSSIALTTLLISLSFFITSCNQTSEESENATQYNYNKADSLPENYLKELGIIKTNIELSANLYETMYANHAVYMEHLVFENAKEFENSTKRALGVGAIGSDLVFTISFNQTQASKAQLDKLLGEAKKLGISEAFDVDLIQKLSSDDSTVNKSIVLTKAYLNAKDQLFSEERAQLATFMVIGGWLEGLYLSSAAGKDQLDNIDVRLGLWEICNTYQNIMGMAKVFHHNEDMNVISEKISSLESLVRRISSDSKNYNSQDVSTLNELVTEIRTSIF